MHYLNYKATLLTLLFTLGCGSALLAERTAQILYFKAPMDAPITAMLYHANAKPLEVQLPRNNFSSSFKLSEGALTLHFLPRNLLKGEAFPEMTPVAKVPASWNKILILAFHDPDNNVMPVKFKVLNANASKLGSGDQMFINYTESNIFGTVGSKKLTLRANSTATIKNAAPSMQKYQVALNRIDKTHRKPVTFIRQTWRQSASRRSLIFIYNPPGTSRVTYYCAPVRGL